MAPVGKTYSIHVYNYVRGEILACRFRPGKRLKIQDLCEQNDVSNGAVREALSRLTSEGLVMLEPQKGYSVMPVSREEFLDLTEARIQLETLCLRLAMENHSVDWEAEVISSHYRLSKVAERDPDDPSRLNERWSVLHSLFHAALVSACPVKHMLRMRAQLYEQSERYRRLSVPLRHADRDVQKEHADIKEAALARNLESITILMRCHLVKTSEILIASGLFENEVDELA